MAKCNLISHGLPASHGCIRDADHIGACECHCGKKFDGKPVSK